jgi:hypothetical protein
MTTANPLLEAAHHFADAGIPVLPCAPGAKTPLTVRGLKDATTDHERVQAWWARWPEANVAIATGAPGFDVLDVDVRPGGSGGPAFQRLIRAGLTRGAVAVVRTPSGGLHVYFPGSIQRSGRLPGLHLDFKAQGGYVLAPPSRLSGGARYLWSEVGQDAGEPLSWDSVTAVLRPESTLPSGRAASRAGVHPGRRSTIPTMDRLAHHVAITPVGERNDRLFWAACEALRSGVTDLEPLAVAAVTAGLDPNEVGRTLKSARQTIDRSAP